jgi:hypothetical protein
MQNDPTAQSPSALQAAGAAPVSAASAPGEATSGDPASEAASLPPDEPSAGGPSKLLVSGPSRDAAPSAMGIPTASPASGVVAVASSAVLASSATSETHEATPAESLQTWFPGQPVDEQSEVGELLGTHWPPLHGMPPPQSLSLLQAQGTHRLEYAGSGQS